MGYVSEDGIIFVLLNGPGSCDDNLQEYWSAPGLFSMLDERCHVRVISPGYSNSGPTCLQENTGEEQALHIRVNGKKSQY